MSLGDQESTRLPFRPRWLTHSGLVASALKVNPFREPYSTSHQTPQPSRQVLRERLTGRRGVTRTRKRETASRRFFLGDRSTQCRGSDQRPAEKRPSFAGACAEQVGRGAGQCRGPWGATPLPARSGSHSGSHSPAHGGGHHRTGVHARPLVTCTFVDTHIPARTGRPDLQAGGRGFESHRLHRS